MRIVLIVFLLVIHNTVLGQKNDRKNPEQFAQSLVRAVLAHNEKETLNHLDTKYVKGQMVKFLHGNQEQFLNELFSGFDAETGEFVQIPFKDILDMKVLRIEPGDSGDNWTVYFQISTNSNTVESSLLLIVKKKKFGFVGAVG